MDRFWANVDKREDSCWAWTRRLNKDGYGTIYYEGKVRYAHRVSMALAGRVIPPGMEVDHLCSNRACVNPAHLEAVSHADNVRRGKAGQYLAARTHCPHGHEYNGENTRTYTQPNGSPRRQCATCKVLDMREYRRRKREAKLSRVSA